MNTNSFKVMIVDDEELVLKALKRSLKKAGFDLLLASSGEEALRLMNEHEVAVIISDYRMPTMSGTDVLEGVKRISPKTVRIVLTGYADLGAAQELVNRCGIYKLIFKPWDDCELKETTSSAVRMFKLSKHQEKTVSNLIHLVADTPDDSFRSYEKIDPDAYIPAPDPGEIEVDDIYFYYG